MKGKTKNIIVGLLAGFSLIFLGVSGIHYYKLWLPSDSITNSPLFKSIVSLSLVTFGIGFVFDTYHKHLKIKSKDLENKK